jgi:hypothetical protein
VGAVCAIALAGPPQLNHNDYSLAPNTLAPNASTQQLSTQHPRACTPCASRKLTQRPPLPPGHGVCRGGGGGGGAAVLAAPHHCLGGPAPGHPGRMGQVQRGGSGGGQARAGGLQAGGGVAGSWRAAALGGGGGLLRAWRAGWQHTRQAAARAAGGGGAHHPAPACWRPAVRACRYVQRPLPLELPPTLEALLASDPAASQQRQTEAAAAASGSGREAPAAAGVCGWPLVASYGRAKALKFAQFPDMVGGRGCAAMSAGRAAWPGLPGSAPVQSSAARGANVQP